MKKSAGDIPQHFVFAIQTLHITTTAVEPLPLAMWNVKICPLVFSHPLIFLQNHSSVNCIRYRHHSIREEIHNGKDKTSKTGKHP